MSSQVLPKEVRLTAPPTMPQARSYLFKQQATQSSYSPGSGNIQINIPRLQRSYLSKDSYLKFRLGLLWDNDNDLTVIPCFDTCGAFGLFDTIEVYDYLGSTLLERTSGHGQLMALLMDTHCTVTELRSHFGAASGCKAMQTAFDLDVHRPSVTPSTAAHAIAMAKYKQQVSPPVSGATFGNHIIAATNTDPAVAADSGPNNGTYTRYFEYTVPLFSFLGTLSKKYAPLHNGYTINITLNSAANALGFCTPLGVAIAAGGTAPTTYTLSEVYFCSQVLELGPVAESMLIASTQGQPFVVPTKAYRNYVGSLAANSTQYRLDLNLNVASLTNVMFIMRPTTNIGSILMKSLSYRIRNYLQSWYFQYGSTILPQTTGIQCRQPTGVVLDNGKGGYTEAYNELMKARHNYSNANTMSMITPDTFWIDTPAAHSAAYIDANIQPMTAAAATALSPAAYVPPGKFAGGLDLELVPGRSNDLVCGMNTNGMNTSLYLNFDTSQSANIIAAQVDAWCEYDAFINISPGIATTVSF